VDSIDVQPDGVGAIERRAAPAGTLPAPLASFVGREPELRHVVDLLGSERLVTLCGPAGCGKTRLALEAAWEAHAAFDRVSWIELSRLDRGEAVPALVRQAIGAPGHPDEDDVELIARHLAGHRHLLVLDNCEHVLAAASTLVLTVLRACPELVVMTTSRQVLGLPGEVLCRVPPLATPPRTVVEARVDPSEVEQVDAVVLFVDRAQRLRPDFRVDGENAAAVAEIVRRLDGLPLAIELAASRIPVLAPEQLARSLGRRFDVLTGGTALIEPHHRTLEASIDWSHDLLEPLERVVLRRLAVFSGGFTFEGVEAVVCDESVDPAQVLDLVAALIDRSMVQTIEPLGAEPRFGLLETIRAYAAERLDEAGEAEAVRDRHLAWAAALARRCEPRLTESDQQVWLDRLEAEHPDLSQALAWAAHRGLTDVARHLCADLAMFWVLHGHYREAVAQLDRALAGTAPDAVAGRPRAQWALGYVYLFAGDHEAARRHAEAALESARRADDASTAARALNVIGMVELYAFPETARPALVEGIELARTAADEWCLSDGLCLLGTTWTALDRFEEAEPFIAEAFEIASRRGDREHLAWNGEARQVRALRHGDLAEADAWYERGMAAAVELGDPTILAALATVRVESLVLRGRLSEAWALIERSIDDLQSRGVRHQLPGLWAQLAVSSIGCDDERRDAALRHLGEESDVAARLLHAALAVAACHVDGSDRVAARDATGHALAIARIMDDPWLIAEQLRLSGLVELPDDPVRAEALLHEALTVAVDHGFEPSAACSLDGLAAARAARGLDREAARLFGAATACFERIGMVRPGPGRTVVAALEQLAEERLGPRGFADAAAEGGRLTLADAVRHARGSRGARGRPSNGWASLTPTEERVVALVRQGLTNPQIAVELFVSAGTVKSHLSHIFRKLGVATRAELASAATLRLDDAPPGSVTPPR